MPLMKQMLLNTSRREGCRLTVSPKSFDVPQPYRPAPFRWGKQKEGPFMGRLREGFARFDNPMQDYQLGKEPDSSTGAVVPPS